MPVPVQTGIGSDRRVRHQPTPVRNLACASSKFRTTCATSTPDQITGGDAEIPPARTGAPQCDRASRSSGERSISAEASTTISRVSRSSPDARRPAEIETFAGGRGCQPRPQFFDRGMIPQPCELQRSRNVGPAARCLPARHFALRARAVNVVRHGADLDHHATCDRHAPAVRSQSSQVSNAIQSPNTRAKIVSTCLK